MKKEDLFNDIYQCPKLRVHPAPEVHDFDILYMAHILAWCIVFKGIALMCAPEKTLISNTEIVYVYYCNMNQLMVLKERLIISSVVDP